MGGIRHEKNRRNYIWKGEQGRVVKGQERMEGEGTRRNGRNGRLWDKKDEVNSRKERWKEMKEWKMKGKEWIKAEK